jgi:hypothetical protein
MASVSRTIELVSPARGERFTRGRLEHTVTSEALSGQGRGVRVRVRLRNGSASDVVLEVPPCSIDLRLRGEESAAPSAAFSRRKAVPRCGEAHRRLTMAAGDSVTFAPVLYASHIGALAAGRYELRVALPWLGADEVAAGTVIVR